MDRSSRHKTGFPPVVNADSRLLILGSMPGERSLADQQYYAHPRNLFWPFIAALCHDMVPEDYTARKKLLLNNRIAVWDVCDACIREGSLDTAILDEIPNAIEDLLDQYPGIRTIAFNGQKAAALFRKYFKRREGYNYITLPSTSPANAGIPVVQKQGEWMKLKEELGSV